MTSTRRLSLGRLRLTHADGGGVFYLSNFPMDIINGRRQRGKNNMQSFPPFVTSALIKSRCQYLNQQEIEGVQEWTCPGYRTIKQLSYILRIKPVTYILFALQ